METTMGSAHHKQSLQDFRSRLCALRCLDRPDLVEAGVIAADDSSGWVTFAKSPSEWFLHCDDATAEKVWALVDEQEAAQ
jgi:hypothetical protein